MAIGARTRLIALWVAAVVIVGVLVLCYKGCVYRPPFDPDAIAAAETAMWQAYYSGNKKDLALELVDPQRNQFGLTFVEASKVARDLATAALDFSAATGNYEAVALPELERAYARIRDTSGADFDPTAAAQAELAWWVARRTPGRDAPEQVGAEIANLYAVLYGRPNPSFDRAGLLRAQAAHLRDQGGRNADWAQVQKLLQESYRELTDGIR
jgi:hypothetical protein